MLDLVDDLYQQGLKLHKSGKVELACQVYTLVLNANPEHSMANHNMGALAVDIGKVEEALPFFEAALEANADVAQFWVSYIDALINVGRIADAQAVFGQAKNNGAQGDGFDKLEHRLKDAGQEPLEANQIASEPQPKLPNILDGLKLDQAIKLAKKQAKEDSPEEAKRIYQDILTKFPKNKRALDGLTGLIGKPIGRVSKAQNPPQDQLQSLINLYSQGQLQQALQQAETLVQQYPNSSVLLNIQGAVLKGLGQLDLSVDAFDKALAIKPDYADAHYNMGLVLQEQGKLEEAIEAYNKALAIKPDYAGALSQAYSVGSLMSDWAYISTLENRLLASKLDGKQSVYGLLALADKPSMHLEKTNGLTLEKYKNTPKFATKPFQKSKRIKLGYFSSYFRSHPVSILSTQMLEYTNREQFELFAFHYGPDSDDPYNLRLRDTFDHFINVSKMTDKEVAELAYQKGIDIAIEFNGFMRDARVGILAQRPAPVQINYLAYPGTMGADFYDYIIGDHVVIPEDQKHNYAENIIYLPDGYMPQDNTRGLSNKPISRTDCGLPKNGFVFCCFNNSFKISPQEFNIWMRLLNKIEGSVLWLLKANKWSENNLRNEASKRGVDADRLVFADKLPLEEHLGRLRLADLFLDTFNFNAHTTASDALWAGIPVVTKIGKSFAARVAGSLLTAIELPELITTTEQEYEALALSLASNPKTLTSIKKKLAEKKNSAPLFDTEKYTKNLERAYVQAYQRYADGLPPAEFKVL
jgi:predicted O-linked N-acetylglucosamine transferase (SPINDLY family)